MPAIDLTEITSTRQLVDRMIGAFNVGDLTAATLHLAPYFTYDEVTTGRRTLGVAAFTEALAGWRAAFPDLVGVVAAHTSSGGVAATEVTWTGTHLGDLVLPTGVLPATGRRVSVRSCLVDEVDADFTQRASRHYLDVTSMLAQLTGAAAVPRPAPATG